MLDEAAQKRLLREAALVVDARGLLCIDQRVRLHSGEFFWRRMRRGTDAVANVPATILEVVPADDGGVLAVTVRDEDTGEALACIVDDYASWVSRADALLMCTGCGPDPGAVDGVTHEPSLRRWLFWLPSSSRPSRLTEDPTGLGWGLFR